MYLEGMVSDLSTTPLRKRGGAASVEKLEDVAAFRSGLRQYLNGTEAATAAAGLTPRRYDLLLMVEAANRAGKPATVSMLCRRLALKQPTVSELVKRAEAAGLIRRARSLSDGRSSHLEVTDDGRSRLVRVVDALRDDRAAFAETFERLAHR